MADLPVIITPYVFTVEDIPISAQEIFQAIKDGVENASLPDIKVELVGIVESSGLFSKTVRREHLRVTCDYTTFQAYVAPYAERYTIVSLRKYVDDSQNKHKGLKSMNEAYIPRDIQNLRVKKLESSILDAIKQVLTYKGVRPEWTTHDEPMMM